VATSRVIGLDIGSSGVRAAELEFGSGGPTGKNAPTLLRYGHVPLRLGAVRDGEVVQSEIVSQALRELWAHAKFESKDVVLGVGNQRVVVRDFDMPWMPLGEVKSSLAFQVTEALPMAMDDALLDFFPTGEGDSPQGRTLHGMLVAAQRATVSANVLAVEAAGLHPTMVDLNGFALLRALGRGDAARGTTAFVDIGAGITTVVIAVQGAPRLVRFLPSGGQSVTGAVANVLKIAPADAEALKRQVGIGFAVGPELADAAEAVATVTRTLVESIRNTFVYYSTNNPGAGIDLVVLTGGGSHLPGLGQYISSSTRLAVSLGDPLVGLKNGKNLDREALRGNESLVAIPVGLAYGVAA
jgi:type IV pilus assembly protein PilM